MPAPAPHISPTVFLVPLPPTGCWLLAFSYTLNTGVSLGPVLAPWVQSRSFLSLPSSWNFSFSSVGCGFCVTWRALKPFSNPFLSSWFYSISPNLTTPQKLLSFLPRRHCFSTSLHLTKGHYCPPSCSEK